MPASFILILTIMVSGCAAFITKQDKREEFFLLPITMGPENFVYKQHITLKKHLQQHDFIAVTKLDNVSLSVVVLLPSGQKVFSAFYDGQHFTQSSQAAPDIPIQEIVSIMQFALWPRQSLETAYPLAQGWVINSSATQRLLMKGSKLLLEVNNTDQGSVINNVQSSYQVEIRHLN